MRRSFSTERRLTATVALALTLLAAPTFAGTLEESLAAEVELARSSDLYLLVDTGKRELAIKAHGLVLDGFEIRRLGVRSWGPLLRGAASLPEDLPPVSTITRSAPQRREIVIGGASQATTPDEVTEAAGPPIGLATPPVTGTYACLLDNGWLLEIRDHGENGRFWRRLWSQLSHPFASRRATRQSAPTLVVELATEDAERLRHLFRRDTAILVR